MGALMWHGWARLLALTSGACPSLLTRPNRSNWLTFPTRATDVAWAALWGLFYRKFFWDFVGGRLGPHGIVPPPQAALFEKLIVKFPVLQCVNIVNGLVTLALEWPLPVVKKLDMYGSINVRLGLYLWSAFVAAFVYQTAFASLFYLVTLLAYARALKFGESILDVKTVEGRRGRV
ncbi:hypothetical protein JCM10295v2_005284 [Rhodotorula toruloides]